MYTLNVNGYSLDVAKGASIRINAVNPAFDADRILREYTFSFRIVRSAQSDLAFQHQGRMDAARGDRKFSASIELEGIPVFKGYVRLRNASRKYFAIDFSTEIMDKWEEIKDAQLATGQPVHSIPQTRPGSIIITIGAGTSVSGNWQCYMSINGEDFNRDIPVTTVPSAMLEYSLFLKSHYSQADVIYSGGNAYITLVTTRISTLNLGGSLRLWDTSPDFGEVKHLNFIDYIDLYSVFGNNEPIRYPIIGQYDREATSLLANNWQLPTGWARNVVRDDNTFNTSFMPVLRVKETILNAFNKYNIDNIQLIGTDFDEDDILNFLFTYSNRTVDDIITLTRVVEDGSGGGSTETTYIQAGKWRIDYNEHVPQVSLRDMVFALAELINGFIYFRGTTLVIKSLKHILSSTPLDWTPDSGEDYEIEFTEKSGVTFDYDRYTAEQEAENTTPRHLAQLEKQIHGEGENEHIFSFSCSYQDEIINRDEWDYTYRFHDDIGPDKTINKIIFGWVPEQTVGDINFQCIPILNSSNYNDPDDETPTMLFPFSLDLSRQDSFKNIFYHGWENIYGGDEIEIEINLAVHDLIEILRWEKPLRWLHDEEGSFLGIIKEVKFTVSDTEIKPATVKLIKLKAVTTLLA